MHKIESLDSGFKKKKEGNPTDFRKKMVKEGVRSDVEKYRQG